MSAVETLSTTASLAEELLGQGEPLLAYDIVSEALAKWPNDVRLRQLQGLALARSGATARANTILETLQSAGQTDEETLGMLGRTYKDLASYARSASERDNFLRRAADTYVQAYRSTGGYWTGINAATTILLIGQTGRASELARKVRAECLETLKHKSGDQYWLLAALGEAALILQDWSQAEEWYERAVKQAGHRFGDIHSSRRNAHLILQYWKEDSAKIDKYLHIPSVTVFTGHMIDHPDRASPRFPGELESAIAKEIRSKIDVLKPGFGFASAACGSDILFLEAMFDAGAEISIVLPYEKEQFVRDSVDFLPNSNWRARFDRVLEQAKRVITASPQKLEIGGVAYEFCNQLLLGLATIRARQLDTGMIPLAVWDGMSGDGPGGAASAIQNWRSAGYKPEIIDPAKISAGGARMERAGRPRHGREARKGEGAGASESLRRADEFDGSAERRRTDSTAPSKPNGFASRVVAILFADAVGFSKLNEAEVPHFVEHFLGAIARLSEKFRKTIIAKNTWGDGLYFVFSDVDLAGKFALELADFVATSNWEEKGLRAGLNLRIGLHAGPVYEFDDPITGLRNYWGTHVSRAARIEPITPPGQVYASEAFAALAAAQRTSSFICDYVGQTPMAKGYGTLPLYHVRAGLPSRL